MSIKYDELSIDRAFEELIEPLLSTLTPEEIKRSRFMFFAGAGYVTSMTDASVIPALDHETREDFLASASGECDRFFLKHGGIDRQEPSAN